MRHYNVMFVCTGNSARSIMAEAIVNNLGPAHFTAYSGGSNPAGFVRPEAIKQIERAGWDASTLRSKSWHEMSQPDSPKLDFVFTLCDRAAHEDCPAWPGQPMTANWGMPDPVAIQGTPEEVERAFVQAFSELRRRINVFLSLPIPSLDSLSLQTRLDDIGKS